MWFWDVAAGIFECDEGVGLGMLAIGGLGCNSWFPVTYAVMQNTWLASGHGGEELEFHDVCGAGGRQCSSDLIRGYQSGGDGIT